MINPYSDVNKLIERNLVEIFGKEKKLTIYNPKVDPNTLEALIESTNIAVG